MRQGEDVGEALGRLVGGSGWVEGLDVVGVEDAADGLDAAGPDNAAGRQGRVARAVEEREKLVGEEVVAKDAGAKDFAKARFGGLLSCDQYAASRNSRSRGRVLTYR